VWDIDPIYTTKPQVGNRPSAIWQWGYDVQRGGCANGTDRTNRTDGTHRADCANGSDRNCNRNCHTYPRR